MSVKLVIKKCYEFDFLFFSHWSSNLNTDLAGTEIGRHTGIEMYLRSMIHGRNMNPTPSMIPTPGIFPSLRCYSAFSCYWQRNTENVLEEKAKFGPGQRHVVWLSARLCVASTVREASCSSYEHLGRLACWKHSERWHWKLFSLSTSRDGVPSLHSKELPKQRGTSRRKKDLMSLLNFRYQKSQTSHSVWADITYSTANIVGNCPLKRRPSNRLAINPSGLSQILFTLGSLLRPHIW